MHTAIYLLQYHHLQNYINIHTIQFALHCTFITLSNGTCAYILLFTCLSSIRVVWAHRVAKCCDGTYYHVYLPNDTGKCATKGILSTRCSPIQRISINIKLFCLFIRCGMPDIMVEDNGQGIVEVAANYTLAGTRWTRPFTYG